MGKVVLYGDKITEAISNLVEITKEEERFRKNLMPKIIFRPKTILKSVDEIMFSTAVADSQKDTKDNEQFSIDKLGLPKEDKIEMVNSLKKVMALHAKELDFEKAAKIRDEITRN